MIGKIFFFCVFLVAFGFFSLDTQASVALERCKAGTIQNRNGISVLGLQIHSLKTVFICEGSGLWKERKSSLAPVNLIWRGITSLCQR